MQTASEKEIAKLITPAADIVKPAATTAEIIPPVNNAPAENNSEENARLINATDLLSGASVVIPDNDTLNHPAANLPESTPAAANGEPAAAAANGEQTPPGEVKRGRGRPRGSRNRPDFSDISTATAAETVVNYEELAGFVFDSSTGTMAMALGDEWRARSPEERKSVVDTLAVYLKSKQVKDIPPGVMLTIVLLAYATPRLKEPATASKIKLGWSWVKFKAWPTFSGFFRRKKSNLVRLPNDTATATAN
jgi:hypothetical protein